MFLKEVRLLFKLTELKLLICEDSLMNIISLWGILQYTYNT
jgi:hypothetical protein